MKIYYDRYAQASYYVLEAYVSDRQPLHTDNIFIHKSADDSFVKVATLAELSAVPEERYKDVYYRKNYILIQMPTLVEIDAIRVEVEKQVNSLAEEAELIAGKYRVEEEIEYPAKTLAIDDVTLLYNEYKKIRDERDAAIRERDILKASRDKTENDFKYIDSVLGPVINSLVGSTNIIDVGEIIKTISDIKVGIKPIIDNVNTFKNLHDTYTSLSFINNLEAVANQTSDQTAAAALSNAVTNLTAIRTGLGSTFSQVNTVSSIKVDINNNIEKIPILSESTINEVISSLSGLSAHINNTNALVNSLVAVVNSIKNKFNSDIAKADKELAKLNSKIDTYNKALMELKNEILIKNPGFDLNLF